MRRDPTMQGSEAGQRRQLRLMVIYAAMSLPAVIWGAVAALGTNVNSPLDWIGQELPARKAYDEFSRRFGPGDVVIASWDGCTIDEPSLDALATTLRTEPRYFQDGKWLLDQVLTGREAFLRLTDSPIRLNRTSAISRLRGVAIGPDEKTTCVLVGLTADGLRQRQRLVEQLHQDIERCCGVDRASQHLAGPVMDGLSVDLASQRALDRLAVPSAIVMLVVCYWSLRSVPATLMVFILSLYCEACTLALVHWCGDTMSALLIVLPPLIQVLTLAGGIHFMNYYWAAAAEGEPATAPKRALMLAWLPCVLSAGTTAIGMASLMVSDLAPVRLFGAYSSAGVVLSTALLLALMPAALSAWPTRPTKARASSPSEQTTSAWSLLAHWIERRHGLIVATLLTTMAVGGWLSTQLSASVRIETLLGADSRTMRDYRWLEEKIGPLVSIEVVIRFDDACKLSTKERFELLRRVDAKLRSVADVGGTVSALTFLPEGMLDAGLLRILPAPAAERLFATAIPEWSRQRLLDVHNQTQYWRLSARVSALSNADYGRLLNEIRRQIEPTAADGPGIGTAGVAIDMTGIMPLVHDIQRRLMNDLLSSFLSAFALIAFVMTLLLGGFWAGIVAMLPNVFPTLIVFGSLGWLQTPVDIGMVMTASIAMGIAVDDTLHFLTFFRRAIELGKTRFQAVADGYRHCGAAMIQTSITCAAGMAVFAAADFAPTARFAWMIVSLIALALVGDIILLPALLLGPAGRFFTNDARNADRRQIPSEGSVGIAAGDRLVWG